MTDASDEISSQTTSEFAVPDLPYQRHVLQPSNFRRNLFKELEDQEHEDSEKVSVYLRVKPIDKAHISDSTLEIIDPRTVCCKMINNVNTGVGRMRTDPVKFTFTRIFGPEVDQKALFNSCVIQRIKKFLNGDDYLLFTYGTTNAGKTYTILGKPNQPGIIPQSLNVIFSSIKHKIGNSMRYKPDMVSSVVMLDDASLEKERNFKNYVMHAFAESKYGQSQLDLFHKKDHTSSAETCVSEYVQMEHYMEHELIPLEDDGYQYAVWVSIIEIYNDAVYDLLEPLPISGKRTQLKLSYDKEKCAYVKGLHYVCVSTPDEAYKVLMVGKMHLRIASTNLNARSSRSHCIFTIKLVKYEDTEEPTWADLTSFAICDLAGSERQKKTLNMGERLKESQNINSSLHILGRCFEVLRSNQMKNENTRIPYRDSKLTQLFQKFLDGKHKEQFMMIVNANPSPKLYEETYHVLRSSAVAFQLVVQPSIWMKSDRVSRFHIMPKKNTISWNEAELPKIEGPDEKLLERPKYMLDTTPNEALLDEVDRLRSELADAQMRLEELEEELRTELCSEFATVLNNKDEYWRNYAKKMEVLDAERLEHTKAYYQEKVKDLEETLEYVQQQLEAKNETEQMVPKTSISRIEKELEDKNRIIEEKNESIKNLEASLNEVKVGSLNLEKELAMIKEKLAISEANVEHYKQRVVIVTKNKDAKVEEMEKDLELARQEVMDLLSNHERKYCSIENERDQMKIVCKSLEQDIAMLLSKLKQQSEEIEKKEEKWKTQVSNLEQDIAKLQLKLKQQNEESEKKEEKSKMQINNLEQDIAKLQLKLKQQYEEIENKEEKSKMQVNNLKQDIAKLQFKLKQQNEEIWNKEEQFVNTKTELMGQNEGLKEKIKELQQSLNQLKETANAGGDKAILKNTNYELLRENETLKERIKELEMQVNTVQMEGKHTPVTPYCLRSRNEPEKKKRYQEGQYDEDLDYAPKSVSKTCKRGRGRGKKADGITETTVLQDMNSTNVTRSGRKTLFTGKGLENSYSAVDLFSTTEVHTPQVTLSPYSSFIDYLKKCNTKE